MSAVAMERGTPLVPWWLILLQGIALLIVGLMLLVAPGATLIVLVQLVGAYWLVSGVFGIVGLFVDSRHWVWKLIWGVLGILAGIVVLQHPLWSAVFVPALLVLLLGIQGVIGGVIELILGVRAKDWGMLILGAVGILFGIILIANPMVGALALPPLLGVLGVVGGIVAIVMAFRAR